MRDEAGDDWDPRDRAVLQDQRRAFDDMRENCPVAYSQFLGWSLFRHSDIAMVLADTDTYSNASRFLAIPNGMDPPEHGQYRAALAGHFAPEAIARLAPRVREIASALLEPLLASGEGEFIQAFATPFSLRSVCVMLGWPEEQWEYLAGWTHDNQQTAFTQDPAAGKALAMLFAEHVRRNLDEQRAAAEDSENATAALLRTRVNGEALDDEQIVSVLRNWVAGHGTVVAGLGNVLLYLSENRSLQEKLRAEPELIPGAIEEILRVNGPLVANRRSTTREVELQGRTLRKGENLSLMWIAANRDPRAFDRPEAVEPGRGTEAAMVWGQGIHLCLGASLARMEMRVAVEEVLARTAGFALSAQQPQHAIYPSNGLVMLHLRCVLEGKQGQVREGS